jgi:hypothetical protein
MNATDVRAVVVWAKQRQRVIVDTCPMATQMYEGLKSRLGPVGEKKL